MTIPRENWGIVILTLMTIVQFFKEKNYTSISVGKIFHNTAAASGPGSTCALWLVNSRFAVL